MDKTRKGLKPPKSGQALMDMYYLEARSHLLETAAILDRIERASEGPEAIETKTPLEFIIFGTPPMPIKDDRAIPRKPEIQT